MNVYIVESIWQEKDSQTTIPSTVREKRKKSLVFSPSSLKISTLTYADYYLISTQLWPTALCVNNFKGRLNILKINSIGKLGYPMFPL